MPLDDDIERSPYVVLTDGNTEWSQCEIEMSRHRPYGDNYELSLKSARRICAARAQTPIENQSDLVLGSILGSFVGDSMYKRLVSSVRVTYPKAKNVDKTTL